MYMVIWSHHPLFVRALQSPTLKICTFNSLHLEFNDIKLYLSLAINRLLLAVCENSDMPLFFRIYCYILETLFSFCCGSLLLKSIVIFMYCFIVVLLSYLLFFFKV